ncbi:hypothetical protein NKH36_13805 [Mesorhizobium sp. M1312]
MEQLETGRKIRQTSLFEKDLAGNLYKVWNRMSSGTYFPPPVRAVSIPKKSGGERILGVPTVSDRIAQMVVEQMVEPDLDTLFLPDSYGYRPGNRLWMQLASRVSDAGNMTGFWNSTSKGCLTIFRTISC